MYYETEGILTGGITSGKPKDWSKEIAKRKQQKKVVEEKIRRNKCT